MKSLLYISCLITCLLFACGDGNNETEVKPNRATGKITNPNAANPFGPSNSGNNGATVESETRVADPNFNDAGVDYIQLAMDICDCSKESSDLNAEMELLADQKKTKEFAAMAPQVDKSFKKAVKCSEGVSQNLGSEFSPYTLVPQMKNTCPDLPAELVAQILRAFGVSL